MSDDTIVTALVPGFLEEAGVHLDAIEGDLEELAMGVHAGLAVDPEEVISRLARVLHTIKGTASCLLLEDIANAVHNVESILEPCRAGRRRPCAQMLTELAAGVESIRAARDDSLAEFGHRAHTPSERPQSLTELLSRLAEMARSRACGRGHAIRCRIEAPDDLLLTMTKCAAVQSALIHILNNCVDHAIQAPEIRRASGKAEILKVTISASADDGDLHLTVADDGPGVDLTAVTAKAIRLGLVPSGHLPGPRDEALILAPGVSTYPETTIRAGRGLGLDAARAIIAESGGALEVSSHPGGGTTLTFVIPVLNHASASTDTGPRAFRAA